MLLDVANPLKQEARQTALTVVNDDSLGEQIQRAFPDARVVKALYTVLPGDGPPAFARSERVVFVCGEGAAANDIVAAILGGFGWLSERIIDLGGIAAARGTEAFPSCGCRRGARSAGFTQRRAPSRPKRRIGVSPKGRRGRAVVISGGHRIGLANGPRGITLGSRSKTLSFVAAISDGA